MPISPTTQSRTVSSSSALGRSGSWQTDVSQDEREAAAKPPLKVFLVEDSVSVRERLMDFLAEPGEIEIVGYA